MDEASIRRWVTLKFAVNRRFTGTVCCETFLKDCRWESSSLRVQARGYRGPSLSDHSLQRSLSLMWPQYFGAAAINAFTSSFYQRPLLMWPQFPGNRMVYYRWTTVLRFGLLHVLRLEHMQLKVSYAHFNMVKLTLHIAIAVMLVT